MQGERRELDACGTHINRERRGLGVLIVRPSGSIEDIIRRAEDQSSATHLRESRNIFGRGHIVKEGLLRISFAVINVSQRRAVDDHIGLPADHIKICCICRRSTVEIFSVWRGIREVRASHVPRGRPKRRCDLAADQAGPSRDEDASHLR